MCNRLIYLFLFGNLLGVNTGILFPTDNFNFTNIFKTSQLCQNQFKVTDAKTLFQMFDASAKSVDGLLYLNMFHLGNFDECYDIAKATTAGLVYGKYCLGTMTLPSKPSLNTVENAKSSNLKKLHIGVCVPNGCTTQDTELLTGKSLIHFSDDFCYSQDKAPKLDSGAIIALIILGVFAGIVIVSSVCELMQIRKGKFTQGYIFAFSAVSNGSKLLSSTSNPDQLLCLNGIKAISMMWVILGHVYLSSTQGTMGNVVDIRKWQENIYNMIIVDGTVSVDSFFTITGLVTVYTFLKIAGNEMKFNIFLYYFHRYIRLTPSLAIMVLIHTTLLPYLGNGPLWNTIYDGFIRSCKTYWWSALLYVQNYFHDEDTCVPQSWYLSVDFQLYLLSPIILLSLHRWPKFCLTILTLLVALSCAIPFGIGYVYGIPAFITDVEIKPHEMMWLYYKQTYARFGPYVVGMIAGYFIYRRKHSQVVLVLHPAWMISIWLICLAGLLGCLYAPYYASLNYSRLSHSLLLAFLRNGWALCLSGVIYMCVAGYGGMLFFKGSKQKQIILFYCVN
ncbi:hypothetical protein Zmor_026815 [Zophobas morio]|uniref:Nose resistant-to-fluoxetine protein N-terminal domain-containing protein n=1 Tax=Zophobas morio TaxID=2755281 RepID=A0AA38HUH6_9CUCU|nr:hypothetical protein Zmor_026815 [Zophobas morio]